MPPKKGAKMEKLKPTEFKSENRFDIPGKGTVFSVIIPLRKTVPRRDDCVLIDGHPFVIVDVEVSQGLKRSALVGLVATSGI